MRLDLTYTPEIEEVPLVLSSIRVSVNLFSSQTRRCQCLAPHLVAEQCRDRCSEIGVRGNSP